MISHGWYRTFPRSPVGRLYNTVYKSTPSSSAWYLPSILRHLLHISLLICLKVWHTHWPIHELDTLFKVHTKNHAECSNDKQNCHNQITIHTRKAVDKELQQITECTTGGVLQEGERWDWVEGMLSYLFQSTGSFSIKKEIITKISFLIYQDEDNKHSHPVNPKTNKKL